MNPSNYGRIAELLDEQRTKESPTHKLWFVGTDGEPCWSQLGHALPLMTEMTLQPWSGSQRYRVLSFEDYPDDDGVTIVRVEVCEAGQRGPFDICEVSDNDHNLEDWFPPRMPGEFSPGDRSS